MKDTQDSVVCCGGHVARSCARITMFLHTIRACRQKIMFKTESQLFTRCLTINVRSSSQTSQHQTARLQTFTRLCSVNSFSIHLALLKKTVLVGLIFCVRYILYTYTWTRLDCLCWCISALFSSLLCHNATRGQNLDSDKLRHKLSNGRYFYTFLPEIFFLCGTERYCCPKCS